MNIPVVYSTWNKARMLAWFRDVQHRLDIMTVAVILNIEPVRLQQFVDKYAEAAAHAAYWKTLTDVSDLIAPTGSSDHNISTAFEANYVGSFRSIYLVASFGPNVTRKVLAAHRDFNIADFITEYVPKFR